MYSRHDWYDDFFGEKDSLQEYYYAMSKGKFTWASAEESCSKDALPEKDAVSDIFDRENDGIIHVTLNTDHAEWTSFNENPKDSAALEAALVDALEKADAYIDFSKYDNDHSGVIENNELGVSFILAGYDDSKAEPGAKFYKSHKKMMLRSHQGIMEYKDNRYFDGVRVDTYIACSDRDIVDDDTEDDTDNNVRQTVITAL